jgi:hypothetical protein
MSLAHDSQRITTVRVIQRSKLWQPLAGDVRGAVPTAGAFLAALTDGGIDGDEYDRTLPNASARRCTITECKEVDLYVLRSGSCADRPAARLPASKGSMFLLFVVEAHIRLSRAYC